MFEYQKRGDGKEAGALPLSAVLIEEGHYGHRPAPLGDRTRVAGELARPSGRRCGWRVTSSFSPTRASSGRRERARPSLNARELSAYAASPWIPWSSLDMGAGRGVEDSFAVVRLPAAAEGSRD